MGEQPSSIRTSHRRTRTSPHSYLAAFRLDHVLPITPVWQPVWLPPILAAGREWRRPAAEARERQAGVEQRAVGYGMPLWRWPAKYLAARELGEAIEPINTLAVLAFAEGADLTTVGDDVIEAAVACGLDADEARASTDDPQIKQALRDATEAASARGVTGLPTVAVGNELLWGDDRLEDAATALATAA